jgi:hypothetical protein
LNLLLIIGVGIGLVIAVSVASFVVINFDLVSYTATGSETFSPAGSPVGRALVVYSPGLSGAGKESAAKIAKALNDRGYAVDLAGVRSPVAADAASYDVVVIGGPLYWGRMCPSVAEYMKNVAVRDGARLGVFGTTGTDKYMEADFGTLSEQVASSIRGGSNKRGTPIKLILTDRVDENCAELVSAVLE